MTLDTQVNVAESDKGFFYNQKKRLEEYEYGKGIFYSEYDNDKNYTSCEDNDSNWEETPSEEDESSDSNTGELPPAYSCRIIFFLLSRPFLYCFFQDVRKSFSRVSIIQRSKSKQ